MSNLKKAATSAAQTIRDYMAGEWDGNEDGWEAVAANLEAALSDQPQRPVEVTMVKKFIIHDAERVKASAERLARLSGGQDPGWSPDSVEEAIEELEVLGQDAPLDYGYEVIETKFV